MKSKIKNFIVIIAFIFLSVFSAASTSSTVNEFDAVLN
mgnify:CR=1 FL=1